MALDEEGLDFQWHRYGSLLIELVCLRRGTELSNQLQKLGWLPAQAIS